MNSSAISHSEIQGSLNISLVCRPGVSPSNIPVHTFLDSVTRRTRRNVVRLDGCSPWEMRCEVGKNWEENETRSAELLGRRNFLRNAIGLGGAAALMLGVGSRRLFADSLPLSPDEKEAVRRAQMTPSAPQNEDETSLDGRTMASYGGCDGCTGGCKHSCEGGCKQTCTGGCKHSCSSTCSHTCEGGCHAACRDSCTGCQGSCSTTNRAY